PEAQSPPSPTVRIETDAAGEVAARRARDLSADGPALLRGGRGFSDASTRLAADPCPAVASAAARPRSGRLRSRVATEALRARLGWHRVAEGVRRPRPERPPGSDLVRGACAGARAAPHQHH